MNYKKSMNGSNKLSLNVKKTKYSFFHKPSKKDDIPLVLPKLNVNNNEIAQTESIKFLGILLDKNLSLGAVPAEQT